MKLKALAFVVLTVAVFAAGHVHAQYVVGDPIADFTLNDAYGTPVSLFDYDGLVIWLVFWTDT